MDCIQLCLDLVWDSVITRSGTQYQFPQAKSALSEEVYSRPVVYRWCVSKPGKEPHVCYIGETDNLFRRIGNYLNAHPAKARYFALLNVSGKRSPMARSSN